MNYQVPSNVRACPSKTQENEHCAVAQRVQRMPRETDKMRREEARLWNMHEAENGL
jgi:hypothetical protein